MRATMTRSGLLLFSLMAWTAIAQNTSIDDLSLKRMVAHSDLRSAGKAFHMELDFVAQQVNPPETGHLSWNWASKDLWRQEITLGTFHQITVRKQDQLFTARNLGFTPLAVTQLNELLRDPSAKKGDWTINKVKQPTSDGMKQCIELSDDAEKTHDWKRQICINPTTEDVLSDEWNRGGESGKEEFADFQPYEDRSYPRSLSLVKNGVPAVRAVVTLLEEKSYDAAEFVAPPNAIVRRQCEHITYPVALHTPSPSYPAEARRQHAAGTSIVSLTVLPDGSVENVQLIGSSAKQLDTVTEQIVKTWKFKPAMCGAEPITYDIQVQVNFRLVR